MGRLGLPELLIIFVILVLLFGAAKIPQLGRGLGEGIRNFRKGLRNAGGGAEDDDETPPSPPTDRKPQEPR